MRWHMSSWLMLERYTSRSCSLKLCKTTRSETDRSGIIQLNEKFGAQVEDFMNAKKIVVALSIFFASMTCAQAADLDVDVDQVQR